jgi:hypothetical protein
MSGRDGRNDEAASGQAETTSGLSRRGLLITAASGFALAAGGLFIPAWWEEAAARPGANGGELGGRRGKDHRGRHMKRSHGDKKDKGKNRNDAPRGGDPLFRSTALTVVNQGAYPLSCTFFYRVKTGLDDYGLPIANGTQTVRGWDGHSDGRYRYDPDRYRVGVLIKQVAIVNSDIYADVRNVSFWYPRGGVTKGANLDPAGGNFGTDLIPEQDFIESSTPSQEFNVILQRMKDDSQGARRIEWELIIK